MKKVAVFLLLALGLSSCGSWQNSLTKTGANLRTGDWRVTLWSGGEAVKQWDITNGFVSEEQGSDGWFFNYQGKLIRISGDVSVEEL